MKWLKMLLASALVVLTFGCAHADSEPSKPSVDYDSWRTQMRSQAMTQGQDLDLTVYRDVFQNDVCKMDDGSFDYFVAGSVDDGTVEYARISIKYFCSDRTADLEDALDIVGYTPPS